MSNLSKIHATIIDAGGMFPELARTLGKSYGKVRYMTPWQSENPDIKDAWIGKGCEEFERVESYLDYADDTDLFIFPDLGFGAEQEFLVNQGYNVWGSKKGGDLLEFDRIGCKKMMEDLNLPLGPYYIANGIDDLCEYLKTHQNVFVKFCKYRAEFETFLSINYHLSESKLNHIRNNLGPIGNKVKFICEKILKNKFELAVDAWSIDGQFPKKVLQSIEVKNLGCIGMIEPFDEILPCLTEYDMAIAPHLKASKYRNFLSCEKRVGEDQIAYQIDVCARMPSPPSETYEMAYGNLPEIIWQGSQGILVEAIETKNIYAAEFMLYADWAEKHWQPIDFPPDVRDHIKLRNFCKIDGKYYIIPKAIGNTIIGSVVAVGKTIEQAVEKCTEIADTVRGDSIHIANDALEKVIAEVDKAESFGISVLGRIL